MKFDVKQPELAEPFATSVLANALVPGAASDIKVEAVVDRQVKFRQISL